MVPLEERDHQREPQQNGREVTINLIETTSFYSRTTTFDSQASFQNNDIGLEALPTFLLPLSLAFAFSISLSLSLLTLTAGHRAGIWRDLAGKSAFVFVRIDTFDRTVGSVVGSTDLRIYPYIFIYLYNRRWRIMQTATKNTTIRIETRLTGS